MLGILKNQSMAGEMKERKSKGWGTSLLSRRLPACVCGEKLPGKTNEDVDQHSNEKNKLQCSKVTTTETYVTNEAQDPKFLPKMPESLNFNFCSRTISISILSVAINT